MIDPDLVLTMPIPPFALSQNARGRRHMGIVRMIRQHRALAESVARESMKHSWQRRFPVEAVAIQTVYYSPRARSMDPDNIVSRSKAAYDGFADAGLVANDRAIVHLPSRAIPCKQKNQHAEMRCWFCEVSPRLITIPRDSIEEMIAQTIGRVARELADIRALELALPTEPTKRKRKAKEAKP